MANSRKSRYKKVIFEIDFQWKKRYVNGGVKGSQLAAHILDAIAPGWLKLAQHDINASLLEAWRHCGWRFDIERLHPGMSDAAWLLH